MNKSKRAILMLEDGRCFEGRSFGAEGEVFGESVFNTSMSGYQEILTDPSYKSQIVTMTYPMIGNSGVNERDTESSSVQVSAFVVKEYSKLESNYRSEQSLGDYLKSTNVMGIEGVDTRALTKHLRTKGAMRAGLSTVSSESELLAKVKASPEMEGQDLVQHVTASEPYTFDESSMNELLAYPTPKGLNSCHILVYDFGVKKNILRKFVDRGCKITVVPATYDANEALSKYNPDGIFLSNGPGDPAAVSYAIENVKVLLSKKIPIFGICLGHQILSLASGALTYKLKFGHRGGNQPVMNLETKKVEITAQNHGFAVDETSVDSKKIKITHMNLNDQTVEGVSFLDKPFFSIQYHPEASPGPHDSDYLFDQFVSSITA